MLIETESMKNNQHSKKQKYTKKSLGTHIYIYIKIKLK